jgi:hypothetical protein
MGDTRNSPVTHARSRTAVLGYLAAAAAGQRLDRSSATDWFNQHGLAIRDRGLRDALTLRLRRQGERPQAGNDPAEQGWVRENLDFDATKLDLDLALVVFPGQEQPNRLMDVLRSTDRVIRVYNGYERDVVALIVYDGARERRQLQTLLEEHEPQLRWIVVRDVDDHPAARTWLSLCQRVAAQELLLTR